MTRFQQINLGLIIVVAAATIGILIAREEFRSYDEDKIYYTKVTYHEYKDITAKKDVSIIAVNDLSSTIYEEFEREVNELTFKYKEKIYYLDRTTMDSDSALSYFEETTDITGFGATYMVAFKNNERIGITNEDFEKFIEKYME